MHCTALHYADQVDLITNSLRLQAACSHSQTPRLAMLTGLMAKQDLESTEGPSYLATHRSRRRRWVQARAVTLGDSNKAAT